MNRLTRVEGLSTLIKDGWKKKDTEKNYTSICYGCEEIRKCVNKCGFCKALDKLAAYEDTGLEPEQVKQLNDAFKNSQKKLEKAFDDLLEYKKLEEQGLLMRLPCKPYVKVYEIYTKYDEKEDNYVRGIEELLLMRFGKNQYFEYAILKREDGEDSVTLEQFGKTVFLTRAEAEKALNKEE